MKKILGLDLGVASIGWAMIEEPENENEQARIVDMGVRIVPLDIDESQNFTKGISFSKSQDRRMKRGLRRGYDRYQLRKIKLRETLEKLGMMPDATFFTGLSALELYGLRDRAVKEKISLKEIGRIFFHLNQKRGYKSSKIEESDAENADEKKQKEYVQTINNRYEVIRREGVTIGQFFYHHLQADAQFRIKELVFPRAAYIEEFDRIWKTQKAFYAELLTDQNLLEIRDRIIFYQRPLKSQKGLVSLCEFELKSYANSEGKEVFNGPKVAPKSSPLFQVCKMWESINNINITDKRGEPYEISTEARQAIFDYLDNHKKLSQTELFKILGLKKNSGYFTDELISKKGLQGNVTKCALFEKLKHSEELQSLLQFDLDIESKHNVDERTGEITMAIVKGHFEQQPLYKLWHIIYSIPDAEHISSQLQKVFGIDKTVASDLAKLDFTKAGFGNKSAKAMRKIIPALQEGLMYSEACDRAGYNHSNSITKQENIERTLHDKLPLFKKNSLRQPVVEKILNQTVHVVNALFETYGKPDEIRVELARELKQNLDERNDTFDRNNKREKYHDDIIRKLQESNEFKGEKVTRRDIERYKLWEEFGMRSPYEPKKVIGLSELFSGRYDIEHIIPKSRLFDDSFANKTICPRHVNSGEHGKNQMTAFDFMKGQGEETFQEYLDFISDAHHHGIGSADIKISKSKYDKLRMSADKIPQDFINRQLGETRYITRKATEMLSTVCRDVHVTSGSVTSYLRYHWGWEDVLVNLNYEKFEKIGKAHIEKDKSGKERKIIDDWSKRNDHRHHAIDALAIACTKQSIIHRLNSLNQNVAATDEKTRMKALKDSDDAGLEKYVITQKRFDTHQVEEVVAGILISFKRGKKVATFSKRKVKKDGKKITVQKNIITPRGALSEESVYGKIKRKEFPTIKFGPKITIEQISAIVDDDYKEVIMARLAKHGNDPAIAFKNLKKDPILFGDEAITEAKIMQMREDYVFRYALSSIKSQKDADSIVDDVVKYKVKKRLEDFGNDSVKAFKEPLWMNERKKIPIKSVRCFTGLTAVEPIMVEDKPNKLVFEKFVKPGSNHHVAIYRDKEGILHEHVVTFWHAVERKKHGIPVVIRNSSEVWSTLLEAEDEDSAFLKKLPEDEWQYLTSLQQYEMFVLNMTLEELQDASSTHKLIAPHLFFVRSVSEGLYWLSQQYETEPHKSMDDKKAGRSIQVSSSSMTGIKVSINNLGKIIKIGE